MTKYRRIEINAFRRRVTIVSGDRHRSPSADQPVRIEDWVSLNDNDSCESVEPDSPEGQMILVEAIRSLERRLSPQAPASIVTDQGAQSTNGQRRSQFLIKALSLYRLVCPNAFGSVRKEK
jgi:hypothetical protein